jgi:hypothetical protein
MKRVFSCLTAVLILISAFGFTGRVQAAGPITYVESKSVKGKGVVFVFQATGYKNKDVKGATLVLFSDDYKVSCHVNKKESKIVCVASNGLTQYAGAIGFLTVAGQTFAVNIPAEHPGHGGSISCPEGTTPGADVTFFTSSESTTTFFVPGSTISEVRNNAEGFLGEVLISIEDIGPLHCDETPQ